MEINIRIGQLIKQRRLEVGMTQKQLSEITKMTQPSIIEIEKGRRGISLQTLYRLCEALNLEIELKSKP